MRIKVLGINGSARRNGWTAKFLKRALIFSQRAGAEIKLINLVDYPMNYCAGNYSEHPALCHLENCIKDKIGDAFGSLVWDILESEAIIFASPVYWYSPSALLKTLIERLTSLENQNEFMLRGKVAGVIVIGEEDGGMQVGSQILSALTQMGFIIPPLGVVYAHRLWRGDRIHEALEDAAMLGVNVVKLAEMVSKQDWGWIEGWRKFAKSKIKRS
ncbi:MAG: flavodoxin family protein [candidate division WOR-3 bacterium]